MSTLNIYIYGQTIRGLLLTFAVIISLVILVDFVELSRRFGSYETVNLFTLLYLTLLKMPSVVEQTLPFIVLFGVMWSMFRLNRSSELIAMRAAGYSAWKFVTPPTVIAILLGLFGTMALNPGVSILNDIFENERLQISRAENATISQNLEDIWLRESTATGSLIIYANTADPKATALLDVTFYYYNLAADETPVFLKRIDAAKATLRPGYWLLTQASEIKKSSLPVRHRNLQIQTDYDINSLLEHLSGTSSISFWQLPRMIENARAANLDSRRYELQWNRMLALPLTLAAMALIGAAFSFRLVRLGGIFGMAFIGGATGFFLYFAGDLLEALGATRVLPPLVASWAAPAFVLFAGLARITMVEDG